MYYAHIFDPQAPGFYLTALEDSAFASLYLQFSRQRRTAAIRLVRGTKSKTLQDFFDEISAALQFPYYFGENWAALSECITDLDWLPADAYLLMISKAQFLLAEEADGEFEVLMRTLASARTEWMTPNQYIPRSRPVTSFHVLFQYPLSDLTRFSEKLAHIGITAVLV